MDEQKHLKNEQGEPGNKTEKSEYLFMQETYDLVSDGRPSGKYSSGWLMVESLSNPPFS